MENSNSQATWRKRQREEKGRLTKKLLEKQNQLSELQKPSAQSTEQELAAANRTLAKAVRERDEAKAALQAAERLNQTLHAQIRALREQLTRAGDTDENHLDEEIWRTLAGFDEKQLRQWVLAGGRFAEKKHDSPVDNAVRWAIENRLSTRS